MSSAKTDNPKDCCNTWTKKSMLKLKLDHEIPPERVERGELARGTLRTLSPEYIDTGKPFRTYYERLNFGSRGRIRKSIP